MSDGKQSEAGSGKHTPQKGEQPHGKEHKHADTGEHEKNKDKAHRETVKDAKGTAKYTDGA
ncbi:hypothetical protein [Lichenibacterium dinghuense]|uniref:hypothetical protein n=1 Tax=Lichenibacterium dinghuense TaxID=2895977 RepID=UPI001F460209|nr:hypothetical protein [Lichenibacterium sp. 6Y81]